MATTYTESNETRLIFTLERGNEKKTRTIALPGIPDAEGTRYNTVIANFATFRTQMITTDYFKQFVQPSDWLDTTGSSEQSASDGDPWTTTNVEMEFYVVQKTRFDGQE